jgi:DNA-binding NarL/FixJ family response regulator
MTKFQLFIKQRNKQIADMISKGFSYTVIGAKIGVSHQRVQQIAEKLNLSSRDIRKDKNETGSPYSHIFKKNATEKWRFYTKEDLRQSKF